MLDKQASERLNTQQTGGTSVRSSGSKIVTFKDETEERETSRTKKTPTIAKLAQPYASPFHSGVDDEDSSSSNEYSHSVQSESTNDIQPLSRKNLPSTGVHALVPKSSTTNSTGTVSVVAVRPKPTTNLYQSER